MTVGDLRKKLDRFADGDPVYFVADGWGAEDADIQGSINGTVLIGINGDLSQEELGFVVHGWKPNPRFGRFTQPKRVIACGKDVSSCRGSYSDDPSMVTCEECLTVVTSGPRGDDT